MVVYEAEVGLVPGHGAGDVYVLEVEVQHVLGIVHEAEVTHEAWTITSSS